MTAKYKLLSDDTVITPDGTVLYRIQALKDFNDVKEGDLGGYVESVSNLDQDDNAWVFGNARVRGNTTVRGDTQVSRNYRKTL